MQGPLRQLPVTAGAQPPQQLVQQGTLLPSFLAAAYHCRPWALRSCQAVGISAKLLAALAVIETVQHSCQAATLHVLTSRPDSLALSQPATQGAWEDCDDEDLPAKAKHFQPRSLVQQPAGKQGRSGRKRKSSAKGFSKRRKSGVPWWPLPVTCRCASMHGVGMPW